MEHVLTVAAEQLQHTRSVHDGLKAQVMAAAWVSGRNVKYRFLRFPKSSEGKEPKDLEREGLCKLKGGR